MFCRYCGASVAADSLFCAKCGKRLQGESDSVADKVIQKLRLKTPYPYFIVLLLCFATWTVWPKGGRAAYSQVKWSIEQDKVLDRPEENLFQQSLSLVVENTSKTPVREIPVDLVARIEPPQAADVVAGFLGRRLLILQAGQPLPLTVVLTDELDPGGKHRYYLEGAITAKPPFKVTYEVRQEGLPAVLASYVVGRR